MLAQQMHSYYSEQCKICEIAVKSELPACARKNESLSHLWERSTGNLSGELFTHHSRVASSLFDS